MPCHAGTGGPSWYDDRFVLAGHVHQLAVVCVTGLRIAAAARGTQGHSHDPAQTDGLVHRRMCVCDELLPMPGAIMVWQLARP